MTPPRATRLHGEGKIVARAPVQIVESPGLGVAESRVDLEIDEIRLAEREAGVVDGVEPLVAVPELQAARREPIATRVGRLVDLDRECDVTLHRDDPRDPPTGDLAFDRVHVEQHRFRRAIHRGCRSEGHQREPSDERRSHVGDRETGRHRVDRALRRVANLEVQVRNAHAGLAREADHVPSADGKLAGRERAVEVGRSGFLLPVPDGVGQRPAEAREVCVQGRTTVAQLHVDGATVPAARDAGARDVPVGDGKAAEADLAAGGEVDSRVEVAGPELAETGGDALPGVRGPQQIVRGRCRTRETRKPGEQRYTECRRSHHGASNLASRTGSVKEASPAGCSRSPRMIASPGFLGTIPSKRSSTRSRRRR
jgi:hypothetical protein